MSSPSEEPSSGADATPRLVDAADPTAVVQLAGALGCGLVVAVPTDTVYGLAARIDHPDAIARLFELKGRRRDAAIAVLVGDMEQAGSMGLLSTRGRRLADAFWPGPLTIVAERPATLGADIGGDGRTVGLRMPDHPLLLRLLEQTGPLATTSANRSGEPTPPTAEAVAGIFGPRVSLYLDGGPSSGRPPSTVVSDVGTELAVLRAGPVSAADLRSVAAGS